MRRYLIDCLLGIIVTGLLFSGLVMAEDNLLSDNDDRKQELTVQLEKLKEKLEVMKRFVTRAMENSPREAGQFIEAFEALQRQAEAVAVELETVDSDGQVDTPAGKMVDSGEFRVIRDLYQFAQSLVKIGEPVEFKTKRDGISMDLDKNLKNLEDRTVIGRWPRQFFTVVFNDLFRQASFKAGFSEEKIISEPEKISRFWREVDFLHEGYVTLWRNQENHFWLWELLENRITRNFNDIKGVSFGKRLDVLKVTKKDYREKLVQLMDSYQLYRQGVNRYPSGRKLILEIRKMKAHNMKRPKIKGVGESVKIGQVKEGFDKILVRRVTVKWSLLSEIKNKNLYEDDLIDVPGSEGLKLILGDRRYIELSAGAVVAGWELVPVVSDTLEQEIAQLIGELGDSDWQVREDATRSLTEIGLSAVTALQAALHHNDPEIKMRATMILKKIESK